MCPPGRLLQAEKAAEVAPIYVAFLKQQQMAANTAGARGGNNDSSALCVQCGQIG